MALSDIAAPGETCPTCNKNLNDVVNGKDFCRPCTDLGEKSLAQLSVVGHLLAALVCLFHFRFYGVISEVIWALERLFKFGDYHPITGKFYKRGYL